MSFTVPSSGDVIATKLELILPELKVALTQRLQAIQSNQAFLPAPPYSGQRVASLGATYLSTLHAGIQSLIYGGLYGRFVKDDLTNFANMADFMSYSGIGAWDTDTSVSNKNLWLQIQTAFGCLKKFAITSDAAAYTGGGGRAGRGFSAQSAWANALAASPVSNAYPTLWYIIYGIFSTFEYTAVIGADSGNWSFDLRPFTLGTPIQTKVHVGSSVPLSSSNPRDFSISSQAWTENPGLGVTQKVIIVLNADMPITMGAINSLPLTTSETIVPNTLPFPSPPYQSAFYSFGTVKGVDPHFSFYFPPSITVYCDLTSSLTYG